jgi:tRNA pseudouridine13 synthase
LSLPPDLERGVGMDVYASEGEACAARARSVDEDFLVEELIWEPELTSEEGPGHLPVYRVEKRSIDTLHLARELSVALKSRVAYGGLKDKRALAVQYLTPTSRNAERPKKIVGEKFSAELIGYLPGPIGPHSVVGNRFRITLRDCCGAIGSSVEEVFDLAARRRVPNFYGLQRFGAGEPGTHNIGREIVKRRFEEAVRMMLTRPRRTDDEGTRAAREAMAGGRYAEGLRLLPRQQDVEAAVARRLAKAPQDNLGALRGAPLKLRRLYVQAYQSYIFNRAVSTAIARGLDISKFEPGDNWCEPSVDGLRLGPVRGVKDPAPPGAAPMVQLPGYAFRDYGSRFDEMVVRVMADEEVSPKDFFVNEMQEASSEGGFRLPYLAMNDPSCSVAGDTAALAFTLAKGQYATVLLREVVKPRDPRASGLA